MTRKKENHGLGKNLTRHRQKRVNGEGSSRHTTSFGSADKTISITENTSLEEFLSNAEAAQRSFKAERGQTRIVRHEDPDAIYEDSDEEDLDDELDEIEDEFKDSEDESDDDDGEDFCTIPKKPDWRSTESTEEFHRLEEIQFLKWKRKLNRIQRKNINLPPFEKNLQFWRQFWKIIEISDVVVQVVDARDPMFYYSQDLAQYVQELSLSKINVVLLNKADYLTQQQREKWSQYFSESDIKSIFFSAVEDDPNLVEAENEDEEISVAFNSANILNPYEVLHLIQDHFSSHVTVGFLGYPNVGKSSTINKFLNNKRLQVSATPGKTKHYQTHVLNSEVKLVDGPGLVIPNLNMTKADMVLAGILPIDNLTDYSPSIDLLLENIPFKFILHHYGITQSCTASAMKTERKNPCMQLLHALGLMRGFMKPGGVPDTFRACKLILKDYVQGKLLFAKAPPEVNQSEFCLFEIPENKAADAEEDLSLMEAFPELRIKSQMHVRGVQGVMPNANGVMPMIKGKKHGNKKKREKARRLYKDPYSNM